MEVFAQKARSRPKFVEASKALDLVFLITNSISVTATFFWLEAWEV
jgi:hypothetical protein